MANVDISRISMEGGAGTSALDADFQFPESFFENVSVLELSALCCDEQLLGYDRQSGSTWIYPTNYSVRDYQFNIVQSALFKNTLVSLPTGLGKTFIAAVVMYNFYRWYPTGKIIFVAPTRPLVAQQIDACYNIMAIPPDHTIEMTGNTPIATRKLAWKQKRVFFATPQVVQNDLESGTCPGQLVRCLVVDEAHRARGRHSYCQLVESLMLKGHTLFRILALSATPGSKVEDVICVVKNLKIAHLELRTEKCMDVVQYSHSRNIQTVVIQLGKDLTAIMDKFITILDSYTRRLVQYNILTSNIGGLSKGRIVMLFKEYQAKEKSLRHPQHNQIMKDFTMVITLYHAMELLTKHGTRVFLNFFDEHNEKTWVGKDDRLTCFLERLRYDLGTDPLMLDRSTLPDGSIPLIKEDLQYGHPKFDHLKNIITEHFKNAGYIGKETKAIVFCEYRESVNLVHCLLLQCRPLIKPQMFIGQGSGTGLNMKPFSQKQQLRVMKAFREGECNVLISTCVGEEGLDVGSVDLIICFDISNKSPIRLVQRCGRTGRERGGRVVILVTEGREHQTLQDCIFQRDNLNKRLLNSKQLKSNLYTANPRMVPDNLKPQCQKLFITVNKNQPTKGQSNLKDLFKKCNEKSSTTPYLTEEEYASCFSNCIQRTDFFAGTTMLCKLSKKEFIDACNAEDTLSDNEKVNLSKWLEWQRNLQHTCNVAHSTDSQMLSELLQYADLKRFNECSTQVEIVQQNIPDVELKVPTIPKIIINKKADKKPIADQTKRKNNIRDLFSKLNRMKNKELCLFNDKYNEFLSQFGIDTSNQDLINTQLAKFNVSSNLIDLIVKLNIEDVNILKNMKDVQNNTFSDNIQFNTISDFQIPDESCIESLTLSVLNHMNKPIALSPIQHDYDEVIHENVVNVDEKEKCDNLDLIDFEAIFENDSFTSDVDDSGKSDICNKQIDLSKQPLDFFGLDNIEDMFADDSFDEPISKLDQKTKSNSQISTDLENVTEGSTSPILSIQYKAKNRLLSKSNEKATSPINCTSFTVTELLEMFKNDESVEKNVVEEPICNKDDICLDFLDASDHSDGSEKSIILCSQKPKFNCSLKKNNTKPNVIIPASSESDTDYDQLNDIMLQCEAIDTINESKSVEKRRLSTSDESSPFFHEIAKSGSPTLLKGYVNKLSLGDKLKTSFINLKQPISNAKEERFCDIVDSDKDLVLEEFIQENVSIDRLSQKFSCKKPTKRLKLNNVHVNSNSDSDEDFIRTPLKRINSFERRKKKTPKPFCEFIDYEAILSEDSNEVSSDEGVDDSSNNLSSFICDEHPQEDNESVDMEAKYLQSVKSPIRNAGKFKIPMLPKKNINVFSQAYVEQDASYELDSFCVDDDQCLTQHPDMSNLEIAEQYLKQRKSRKRNKDKSNKKKNTITKKNTKSVQESTSDDDSPIAVRKKRVCLRIGSGSSSDEFI